MLNLCLSDLHFGLKNIKLDRGSGHTHPHPQTVKQKLHLKILYFYRLQNDPVEPLPVLPSFWTKKYLDRLKFWPYTSASTNREDKNYILKFSYFLVKNRLPHDPAEPLPV